METPDGFLNGSHHEMANTLKEILKINNNSDNQDRKQADHGGSGDALPKLENSKQEPTSVPPEVDMKHDNVDNDAQCDPDSTYQKILLEDASDGDCAELRGYETHIISSLKTELESLLPASNKIKTDTITRFDWDHRYYPGNLLSVTTMYIAYTIQGRASHSVRVINRLNPSERVLLKGFTSEVSEVAFAHATSNVLAAVDCAGNLIVWSIVEDEGKMSADKKLHVVPDESTGPISHRLFWIPHVQTDENGDSDNPAKILVLAFSNIAEVWDLDAATSVAENLPDVKIDRPHVLQSFLSINKHTDDITDCELSPIGNVLAVASYDGYVKFWQVEIQDTDPPNCLHQWKPHDGKPVSAVKFCDNKKHPEQSVFWRFLLTGCERNSELKLWCTVTWNCLQVVKFKPSTPAHALPELTMVLHISAEYLALCDIHRKVLYIMQCKTNLQDGTAQLSFIAPFQLAAPVLSVSFVDTQCCKFPKTDQFSDASNHHMLADSDSDDDRQDEITEGKDANDPNAGEDGVLIKLITVQSRSLQSMDVRLMPKEASNASAVNHSSTFKIIAEDTKDNISIRSEEESPPDVKSTQDDIRFFEADENDNRTSPQLLSLGSDDLEAKSEDVLYKTVESNNEADISLLSLNEAPKTNVTPPPVEDSSTAPDVTQPASTPFLLTPDAFMAPHKSPGDVGESANSSFTAVTPFSQLDNSFYQSSQEKQLLVRNPISNMMSSSAVEDLDEGTTMTPPTSPVIPRESSSSQAHAPAVAAAEILHSMCSRSVQSPDLISSTSTLEDAKHDTSAPVIPPGTSGRNYADAPTPIVSSSASADVFPPILPSISVSNSCSVWPKAPDVTMSRPVPVRSVSDSTQEASSLLQRAEPVQAPVSTPAQPSVSQMETIAAEVFSAKSESIVKLIKDHHEQQMALLNKQQKEIEAITKRQNNMQKREDSLLKRSEQQGDRIEKTTKSLNESQRRLSTDMKAMQSGVTDATAAKMERVIKTEIKRTVLPGLTQAIEPVKEQLNNTVAQKLAATDAVMKAHVGKLLESKELSESIASTTSRAIEGVVQASLRDVFLNRVVPGIEQSCQTMFQQLATAFHRGLDESLNKLEKQIQFRFKPDQDRFQSLIKEAHDATAQMQALSKHIQADIAVTVQKEVAENIDKALTKHEETAAAKLLETFKELAAAEFTNQKRAIVNTVRDGVSEAFQGRFPQLHDDAASTSLISHRGSGGGHVVSRQLHRPSIVDQQQEILKMLQQGNVNTAFQRALTAADLNLVMYVCETVDPAIVFGVTPCPFQQPILLSLIQQLSSDLATRTDLKIRYLQEAVMNLDKSHHITQEYMHSVLSALVQNLQSCAQGPLEKPSLAKDIKILTMATESLMK